jgi:hypothetical protein
LKVRILEKIVGVNGNGNLHQLLSDGYEFIARTHKGCDFYRRGNEYVIYNPKNDQIVKTFSTKSE